MGGAFYCHTRSLDSTYARTHKMSSTVPSYIAEKEAADRSLMDTLCAEYDALYKEYEEVYNEYDEQDTYIRSHYNGWDEPEKGELADYGMLHGIENHMNILKKDLEILEKKIEDQQDMIKERYEMMGEWLDGEGVECDECGYDQMIKKCIGCSKDMCAGCHFLCHDCKWGDYA